MSTMTIREACDDLNKRYTEALRKGLADGSIDPDVIKENQSMDFRIEQ